MTKKLLGVFLGCIVLLALTSCAHEEAPEAVAIKRPAAPKVKPSAPPPPVLPLPPQTVTTHKIGLLLPLSGPNAALGKSMLDAAEMALFETESTSVTLLPQDTAAPGGAGQAALRALKEGAELLLGPIFAVDVGAVKPLLRGRNVNLLCFSTDQNVVGDSVFTLGFLPAQQIERILLYAKENGLEKIAVLTSDDYYGQLIDQTVRHMQAQGQLTLVGIAHYTKGDLLEGNPGNERLIEEVAAFQARGADALFIPEGGENLGHLTRLLAPHVSLKVLGSGQWDAPETLRFQGLDGSLFASTDPEERKSFEERFRQAYGTTPPRIATLAYDGVALAIALADKGYTVENLTSSQGFTGIEGAFRLTPQGLNERGLAILEVTPSGFRLTEHAPQYFYQ